MISRSGRDWPRLIINGTIRREAFASLELELFQIPTVEAGQREEAL